MESLHAAWIPYFYFVIRIIPVVALVHSVLLFCVREKERVSPKTQLQTYFS